jgi:lysozyme
MLALTDGIPDVSHFEKVSIEPATLNVPALILKATQGTTFTDSTFYHRCQDMLYAGKLVGAYHFLDGTDPSSQAAYFLAVCMHASGSWFPKLKLFVDFEDYPQSQPTAMQASQFVLTIRTATGRLPGLYMGRYQISEPNPILSMCDLWLPEYGTKPIPPPGFGTWKMWQYTETGHIPSIGVCDVNRFQGTAADLAAWWKV